MRKLQLPILGLSLLVSVTTFGGHHQTFISNSKTVNEAENLSNDKEFQELFNSMLSFTYDVHKAKATDLLSKYGNKQASAAEIKRLLDISGQKSQKELGMFFSRMAGLNRSLVEKYQLNSSSATKSLIKESVVSLLKKGNTCTASFLNPDCELEFATAVAGCYAGMAWCEPRYSYETCLLLWTDCMTLAWLIWDNCLP